MSGEQGMRACSWFSGTAIPGVATSGTGIYAVVTVVFVVVLGKRRMFCM
jgi:hypothetical protein